jgi:protein pelota
VNVRQRDIEDGYGTVTLVPENLDDLWHLKYVVEDGDTVSALTQRRVERNDDMTRSTGGERETLDVELEVDDVEFARFANRLRVSGVIRSCDRETEIGNHHTVNVEKNDEITVTKDWKPDQLERIEEAEEADENEVAVATVEEGEAHVHTVRAHGVEERATLTGTTGKGDDAAPRKELFGELASVLENTDADAVVLAGPGFTKRDAYDYMEENAPELAETVVVEDTASVGGRGVHEVLKRGAVERVAEEARVSEEARLVDELMERVGKEGAAAYGLDAVQDAVEYGAVEHLLVVDEFLRGHRNEIDPLIEGAEQKGGDVTVLSSEFEPGQRVDHLGGVAALLRYRLN